MRKLIIAIGILTMLAASGIQSWAKKEARYGCYEDKNKLVRVVDNPGDCRSPQIAMALDQTSAQDSTDPDDAKSSKQPKKNLKKLPPDGYPWLTSGSGGPFSNK